MLQQIEGSQAVARTVARCRPEVVCAYPISPQTHIIEAVGVTGADRRAGPVRVHQRGVGVRRHVGVHRGVGRRRPRLHGDGQPGPALHDGGRLQRLRARAPDRDDAGQPGHRRAHQHLERPQRRHGRQRRRVDPAVRRDQPGGGRPPRPGLPPGRGAVAPGHGLHGRLHPHPRRRAGRPPRAGPGRRLPPAVRAPPVPRPGRPGLHRRHGRARGLRGGQGTSPTCASSTPSSASPNWPPSSTGVFGRPSAGLVSAYRTEDADTDRGGAGLGARHHQGRRRRAAPVRGAGRGGGDHHLPALPGRGGPAGPRPAPAGWSWSRRRSGAGGGGVLSGDVATGAAAAPASTVHTVVAGLGGRPITRRAFESVLGSAAARRARDADASSTWTTSVVERERARVLSSAPAGPSARGHRATPAAAGGRPVGEAP